MAIAINDNWTRDQYVAAAGQTVFQYSFPVVDETYIQVYQRGFNDEPNNTTQLLTLGDDYSVTGVDAEEGGTIILVVPATANDIITVIGIEPIERVSVFADLNPLTVTLNQQLNELTIMVKEVETILYHLTPKYRRDELIAPAPDNVRQLNLELPILNDGFIWIGRGNYLDDPDDIVAVRIGDFDALGLLDVDYVVGTGNPALPNAQVLSDLDDGVMVNDGGTVIIREVVGTNGITVTNPDGIDGNIIIDGSDVQSSGSSKIINQANDFEKGDWLRFDKTTQIYVRAIASTPEFAEAIGVVSEVNINGDPDIFRLQQSGFIDDLPYLVSSGDAHFLSETNAGLIDTTAPSSPGQVRKPLFLATSNSGGWIYPFVGMLIGADQGGGINPSGSTPVITTFTQAGHDFMVKEWLRIQDVPGTEWIRAQADTYENAQAIGMVIAVDGDEFTIQTAGFVDTLSALTIETAYWLSPTTPGLMTTTRPTDPNHITKPLFVGLSAASGFILEQRQLPVTVSESANTKMINQPAHGFIIGDVLKGDAADAYEKAQANSLNNARSIGIVIWSDTDNFIIQSEGTTNELTGLGLTEDTEYYLSADLAGAMTAVEPTALGEVSKNVYYHHSDTAGGWIREWRPMLQPNANGGAGAGGGSGIILVGSVDFTGVETEWIFTGISADYIWYKIVVDELSFNEGSHLKVEFGVGSPSVKTGPYYAGGSTSQARQIPYLPFPLSAVGAGGFFPVDIINPMSVTFEINDLSANRALHVKKLLARDGLYAAAAPALQHLTGNLNSGSSAQYLWWGVESTAVTSIVFSSNAGAFGSGSIRIYGMSKA